MWVLGALFGLTENADGGFMFFLFSSHLLRIRTKVKRLDGLRLINRARSVGWVVTVNTNSEGDFFEMLVFPFSCGAVLCCVVCDWFCARLQFDNILKVR